MLRSSLNKTFVSVFCLCTLVLVMMPHNVSYGEQGYAKEYELKAVYLYNFLQFVEWPVARRPESKDGAFVICVIGESPFGGALDELRVNLRKSGMNPIKVVYSGAYNDAMQLSGCQLLFVSSSEKKNFHRIISGLKDAPVLTVGDAEGFLSSGGMINLVQSRGKLRWSINRAAAKKAGLSFSSQLLGMAIKVVE